MSDHPLDALLQLSLVTAALKAAEADAAACAQFSITIQDTGCSCLFARPDSGLIFRPEWRPTPSTQSSPGQPQGTTWYALFDYLITFPPHVSLLGRSNLRPWYPVSEINYFILGFKINLFSHPRLHLRPHLHLLLHLYLLLHPCLHYRTLLGCIRLNLHFRRVPSQN